MPQPVIRPPAPEQVTQTRWCIAGDDYARAADEHWRAWTRAEFGDLVDRADPIVASYIRDMAGGCD